ncbi:hypothetical protein ACFL2C_00095 [Patescibacteria group bacterium]
MRKLYSQKPDLQKIIYPLVIVFVLVLVYRTFLSADVRVATDFPNLSQEYISEYLSPPFAWKVDTAEGFGEYSLSTRWIYPLELLYGLGANLGFPYWLLQRVFGVFLILAIGVYTSQRLGEFFGVGQVGKIFIGVVLLINSYLILLIDGGQFSVGLAFVTLPLVFVRIVGSVDENIKQKIISALLLVLLGVFDIRFVYLLVALVGLYAIWDLLWIRKRARFINWIKEISILAVIFMLLNAYWILPLILSPSGLVPRAYNLSNEVGGFSFTQLKHAILFHQPHWYKNAFGLVERVRKEFIVFPILALIGFIISNKNKKTIFLAILTMVSVFLIKGDSAPLGGLNQVIHSHVPGMFIFRDTTKFFVYLAISYSVFIAIFADKVSTAIKPKILKHSFLILSLVTLLVFSWPVLFGKMTGTFSTPSDLERYDELLRVVEEDPEFSRTLWVPSRPALGKSIAGKPILEGHRILNNHTFQSGVVGTYETMNFLRDTNYVSDLLELSSVRYIAYPYPDTSKKQLNKDEIEYFGYFSGQLSSLGWLDTLSSDPPLALYKNPDSKEMVYLANNTYNTIGSVRILEELKDLGVELSNNALIFNEKGRYASLDKLDNQFTAIVYKKGETDLEMSFVETQKIFDPTKHIVDASGNWWVKRHGELIGWRGFLQEKHGLDDVEFTYGSDKLVLEGPADFKVNIKEKGTLYARVARSTKSSELVFDQNGNSVQVITAKDKPSTTTLVVHGNEEVSDIEIIYEDIEYRWTEVGPINSGYLDIHSEGDINIITNLAVLGDEDILKAKDEIIALKANKKLISWSELSDNDKIELFSTATNAKADYEEISPVSIKIRVASIDDPVTLIFNNVYDPRWEMDNRNSYEIYGLFNGFELTEDGEYLLYFYPQKFVNFGFMVSVTSAIVMIVFLLFPKISKILSR